MDQSLMLRTAVLAKAVAYPEDARWQSLLEQYVKADLDAQKQKMEAKASRKAVTEGVRMIEALGENSGFFKKLFDSGLIENMANIAQARDLYNDITQQTRIQEEKVVPCIKSSDATVPKKQENFSLLDENKHNSSDTVPVTRTKTTVSENAVISKPTTTQNQETSLPQCSSNHAPIVTSS